MTNENCKLIGDLVSKNAGCLEHRVGFIFDIDDVVYNLPHYNCWGYALKQLYGIKDFTALTYQYTVASTPTREGAINILLKYDIKPTDKAVNDLCRVKERRLEQLIEAKNFLVYDTTILFLLQAKNDRVIITAASSSVHSREILKKIDMYCFARDHNVSYLFIEEGSTLYDMFKAPLLGEVEPGKPNPKIFLMAAKNIGVEPRYCVVFEDGMNGVKAAKAAGMYCVGLVRNGMQQSALLGVGADVVVSDLSQVDCAALKRHIEAYNRETK